MKCYLILLLPFFIFFSCTPSPIEKSFSGTDSVVIFFKNETAGIITKTVQTTEKNAISRIVDFIDKDKTQLFDCGYDGKIYFFDSGKKIQEVDFKVKDKTCNHFAFLLNNRLVSTKMSFEAIDFLTALEKGELFY